MFDEAFRARLGELLAWRRDVRRFRTTPLPAGALDELLALAVRAPSVGNSQPWRFVRVERARGAVRAEFARCNAEALAGYEGERARLYAGLKLAGLDDAPVQLAVFVDEGTPAGHGLGRQTMPETLTYSVVAAVHTLWLAARAAGIGVGWVSILDRDAVARALAVPAGWSLVAYLCIGYPEEVDDRPVLERAGWQARDPRAAVIIER